MVLLDVALQVEDAGNLMLNTVLLRVCTNDYKKYCKGEKVQLLLLVSQDAIFLLPLKCWACCQSRTESSYPVPRQT